MQSSIQHIYISNRFIVEGIVDTTLRAVFFFELEVSQNDSTESLNLRWRPEWNKSYDAEVFPACAIPLRPPPTPNKNKITGFSR